MTEKAAAGCVTSAFRMIKNESRLAKTWSAFAGLAAGEAFLLYAIVIAHTLSPVTALLSGPSSNIRGAAVRYREIFNWDGLFPTIAGSLFVVAAVWSAFQLTAWARSSVSCKPLQMALTNPVSGAVPNIRERPGLAALLTAGCAKRNSPDRAPAAFSRMSPQRCSLTRGLGRRSRQEFR